MNGSDQWYALVATNLEKQLKDGSESSVNGVEFLEDYIKENGVGDFIYDGTEYADDVLSSLVTEHIDPLQEYLVEKNALWFANKGSYIWEHRKATKIELDSSQPSSEEQLLQALRDDQKLVFNKGSSKVEGDDYEISVEILKIARLQNVDEDLLVLCHRMVVDSYDRTEAPILGRRYRLTEDLAQAQYKAKSGDCASSYAKAADLASRDMRTEEAAYLYKKASMCATEFNYEKEEVQKYLRRSRTHFHHIGDTTNAGIMYRSEKDLDLVIFGFKDTWGLRAYKLIADYGESPVRVAKVALVSIFSFALLYMITGINVSETSDPLSLFTSLDSLQSFADSLATSIYFSVVTFTTLGYGDLSPQDGFWARALAGMEALWGLFVTSLFLTSLVRKYSRF